MIAWLTRRFSRDPGQLGLFDAPPVVLRETPPVLPRLAPATQAPVAPVRVAAPQSAGVTRDPDALLRVLRAHGLRGVDALVFTRNRRTMVSLASGVLRVHEGFATAPADVHAAIATFATSRNRAKRTAARDVIVAYPVPIRPASRRATGQHADDAPLAARLTMLHAQLNLEHFDSALQPLDVQVSRRLARRLGHYTPRSMTGGIGEIVISRRHIRRDGWPEAIHTLLHEMVHQWQDETGRTVDHGPGFRAKCRAVGIAPAATRIIERG